MADLHEYIDQMRSRGYTNDQIRHALIQAGYPPQTITDILTHSTWIWLLGAAVLITAIATISYLALTPEPFTLSLKPDIIEAFPGTTITWQATITSTVATLTMLHELIDPTTNTVLTQRTDERSITGTQDVPATVTIPPNAKAGRYLIKTTATSASVSTSKAFALTILAPKQTPIASAPSCADDIQNQDETGIDCGGNCTPCTAVQSACTPPCTDNDPCTIDNCDAGTCRFDQSPTCCGDGTCEPGETSRTCLIDCTERPLTKTAEDIINEAITFASNNPERALQLCGSLATSDDADACHLQIASLIGRHDVCTHIRADERHDKCLLSFALNTNDYAACDPVRNTYLKNSCYSLKQLRRE